MKAAAKGAQAGLDKAKSEAETLRKKAAEVESKAKDAYRVAVALKPSPRRAQGQLVFPCLGGTSTPLVP